MLSLAARPPASIEEVIDPIVALGWLVWKTWTTAPDTISGKPEELARQIQDRCDHPPDFEFCLSLVKQWRERRQQSFTFSNIRDEFLPADVPPQEARYFAARSIRRRYGLQPSSTVVRRIHEAARRMSALVAKLDNLQVQGEALRAALIGERDIFPDGALFGDALLELFWILDLLRPALTLPDVIVRPEIANAEYLTTQLFGVSTRIPGFDVLFGGGGLMLADSFSIAATRQSPAPAEEVIGGRVVLTVGPFGSGKSLLALQVAVDIARKGGVAWVMPFEQTNEECLYSMEAIGLSTQDRNFQIFRGWNEAFLAFAQPAPQGGALVLFRPERVKENEYVTFFKNIEKRFEWLEKYPLRLIVVDPLNALIEPDELHGRDLRQATRNMFEAAKRANVNVWLTSEQASSGAAATSFGENVADTVIHLGVEPRHGQLRRYIEVTKSRFQKESSGRHAMAIAPEGGIQIYPSSSTISENLSPTWVPDKERKIDFGVQGIQELLGPEPLKPGDIVAFAGPGKAKTLVGLEFLVTGAQDPANSCVFVSGHDEARMKRALRAAIASKKLSKDVEDNVALCSISGVYADAGQILIQIRNAFEACIRKGKPALRVLITNLSHWEQEVPAIRDDAVFGVALMNLVRAYGAVTLIVSGDELRRGRPIHDIVFDQSDSLLHFHQKELKGRITTLVSAVKTRNMRHKREPFELRIDPSSATQLAPAPLFRSNSAGDVREVRVRLFLNAETKNHREYNERLIRAIQGTLSENTVLSAQNVGYDPAFLSMARYSALDELQILQLDEFQVPLPGEPPTTLYRFDESAHPGLLEGRADIFKRRVRCEQNRFFAVPFYQNVSFLAYDEAKYSSPMPQSWGELAAHCEAWDADNKTSSEVFFSCPIYEESFESYNCLFFEILYSLSPLSLDENCCDLVCWLASEKALEAAYLFRRLCRLSHVRGYVAKTFPRATFWRHWYNTLNQELSGFSPEARSCIRVKRLFGEITSAGEWYLAIPSHSASPDVGLYLIEQLTSAEREIHRLQLGIGLPTREAFYESESGRQQNLAISPYFRFSRADLNDLTSKAIRRSCFRSYERLASSISSHLKWMLEIPPSAPVNGLTYSFSEDKLLKTEIQRTMASLVSNMSFLSKSREPGQNQEYCPSSITASSE